MLAFWLPSTDFRAEVRLLAAGKQAVLPTIAYNRHVFFKEKKLIEEKKMLLIGRRRMKLEGGEKGSFLTCLHRPLPFLRKNYFSLASLGKRAEHDKERNATLGSGISL